MNNVRIEFFRWLFLFAWVGACGNKAKHSNEDWANKQEWQCDKRIDGSCAVDTGALGTNWHPDPDGDGVESSHDLCPIVYNPGQFDSDSDGIGDYCDSDFVEVIDGGPVVDLRAEHVTPYGAWFSFTSPSTPRWGKDYVLAWSTERDLLRKVSRIHTLPPSNKKIFRVFAHHGDKITQPQIVTSMQPDTQYFVTVRELNDDDKAEPRAGNLIEIKTAAAPVLSSAGVHPRAFATSSEIAAIRARAGQGDKAWSMWAKIMGAEILQAAREADLEDHEICLSAALLAKAGGNSKYKKAALSLIESMRQYWQSNKLDGNQLRWANSNLALCADLMWDDLSTSQRNGVVRAYLADDEGASIERIVDTDEYASIVRTLLIDGLVACDAPGLAPELSLRACALLDKGMRAFYGVQLVKTRRDQGFFAQSGGNLPDGIGYGQGSTRYWLQSFQALGSAGAKLDEYGQWIWHSLLAMQIHSLTPARKGYATFGDLDSYDNFSVEPNSLPMNGSNGGLIALYMGLLQRAGRETEARRARYHLQKSFPEKDFGFAWAGLLYDNDEIEPLPDQHGLPTSYLDSGMGMLYARSSWRPNASYLVFRAGWSGADHNHEDIGSFQFYRNGTWITHEALGYSGPAAQAVAHNVPALAVSYDERQRVGQFALTPASASRIKSQMATEKFVYVAADLRGAYSSANYHQFDYDAVERHLFWLKSSKLGGDDRLIVYDLIDNKAKTKPGQRMWQLHIDTTPTITGSTATFHNDSDVQVDLIFPVDSKLEYSAPQGRHSQYPGELYTGRLTADPKSAKPSLRYLSVIRSSDEKSSEVVLGVESTETLGVLTGTDLVLFPRGAGETNQSANISLQVDGPIQIWWTGLVPQTSYQISSSRKGKTLSIHLEKGGSLTTDAAGVLLAHVN